MEQQNQPQPPVFNQPQQAPQPSPQYQPYVTARPTMGFIEAVRTCLKKYFDFKGRARRSEFWWFVLFFVLVYFLGSIVMTFIAGMLSEALGMDVAKLAIVLVTLVALALFFPSIAVLTRRLHDTGRSGWWVALGVLSSVTYGASYYSIMWPVLGQMGTNPYDLVKSMTDALMESPVLATVMTGAGMLSMLLSLVLLIFTLLDSKWETNKYGPSPKYS